MTEGAAELSAEFDAVGEAGWMNVLEQFDDATIYQTWAHSAVRWGEGNLSHCIVRRGNEIVSAAQVQIKRLPVLHSGVANVSWGPLWKRRGRAADEEAFDFMLRALRDEYSRRRGLFLRVHCCSWREDMKARAKARFEAAGFRPDESELPFRTILIDLSQSEEDIMMGFRKRWRKCLRKAMKNELPVRESVSAEDYDITRRLFREVVARKRILDLGDVDLYADIHARLPAKHKLLSVICEMDGDPIATAVWSRLGERSMGLFRANSIKALQKTYCSYLLTWENIIRDKAVGCAYYDEGGYNPEHSETDAFFKDGLGGMLVSHLPVYTACDSALSVLVISTAQRLRRHWKSVRRAVAKLRPVSTPASSPGEDDGDE